MITLIRCILLFCKKVKVKLALYSCLEQAIFEFAKNPEELKKKASEFLANIAHETALKEKTELKNEKHI